MPKVTFTKTANRLWLNEGEPLLEIELQPGNELPFGCKHAACGTCALRVTAGMENLNPKNEEEEELLDALDLNDKDCRLGCQCIIYGDISIEPFN